MTNPYRLQDGGVLVLDKDGNIIKVDGDPARCIVPDGGRVKVPMMLMDGAVKKDGENKTPVLDIANHRPRAGVRSLSDRARTDASHHLMTQRTRDAWKNPTLPEVDPFAGENAHQRMVERVSTANPKAPADYAEPDKVHARMVARTENAWRNPPKR